MDLIIPVSEEFLAEIPGEKGGARPISREELSFILSKNPIPPHLTTGGSSANTLKGLAALQNRCAFLSCTGCDAFGEKFSQHLKEQGVRTYFSQSHVSTSIVLCLVTPDGQRTMRSYSDVATEMSDNFLLPEFFAGVRLLHLDAYTLRRGLLTEKAVAYAKRVGAIVSIDLSSFEIISEFKERILALLPQIDIVFGNEREMRELTGQAPLEACLKLQKICPIVVVLLADKGCMVGHQGRTFLSPGFPAQVIDTTGAGDLFASGFLHGFLHGYPLEKCAKMGNRLGSAIVEILGAELPENKWIEMREFIRNEIS